MDELCTRTSLQVSAGGVSLIHGQGSAGHVPAECLARSKLLQEVLETADTSGEASIPLTTAACVSWLQYVQTGTSTSMSRDSSSHPGSKSVGSDGLTRMNEPLLEQQDLLQKVQALCEILQVSQPLFHAFYGQLETIRVVDAQK